MEMFFYMRVLLNNSNYSRTYEPSTRLIQSELGNHFHSLGTHSINSTEKIKHKFNTKWIEKDLG